MYASHRTDESMYAMAENYCRYRNTSQAGDHGADFGLGWDFLSASESNKMTKTEIDNFCRHIKVSSSAKETQTIVNSVASKDLVNAWAQCMAQASPGLYCTYSNAADDSDAILAYYRPYVGGAKATGLTYTTKNLRILSPTPKSVFEGENWLEFELINKSLPGDLTISGQEVVAKKNLSCTTRVLSPYRFHEAYKYAWEQIQKDLKAFRSVAAALPSSAEYAVYKAVALKQIDERLGEVKLEITRCANHQNVCGMPGYDDFRFTVEYNAIKCALPGKELGTVIKSHARTYSLLSDAPSLLKTLHTAYSSMVLVFYASKGKCVAG